MGETINRRNIESLAHQAREADVRHGVLLVKVEQQATELAQLRVQLTQLQSSIGSLMAASVGRGSTVQR